MSQTLASVRKAAVLVAIAGLAGAQLAEVESLVVVFLKTDQLPSTGFFTACFWL